MASTLLASTAITLSSLIAILMTGGNGDGSMWILFGAKSELFFSTKFFLILLCFLVAFLLNVQSVRYYSHASILINVPFKKMYHNVHRHQLPAEYVARTVNKGSYFWSLGLRAFYFSFPLFLWIFGPIPMFLSCFFLVFMLYFLDMTFEYGWAVATSIDEDENKDEETGRVNWFWWNSVCNCRLPETRREDQFMFNLGELNCNFLFLFSWQIHRSTHFRIEVVQCSFSFDASFVSSQAISAFQ